MIYNLKTVSYLVYTDSVLDDQIDLFHYIATTHVAAVKHIRRISYIVRPKSLSILNW